MVIVSLFLVLLLIIISVKGLSRVINPGSLKYKETNEIGKQYFKIIAKGSSFLEFLIYIFLLIFPLFTVASRYSVLLIFLVLLIELIEMSDRISKMDNAKDYKETWGIVVKELRNPLYIAAELVELAVFVYLFVVLFFQH